MIRLFDEIPYIENEYIILKQIQEKDAPVIASMAANEHVRRYLPTFLFEYGFEDKREAVRQMYGEIFEKKESLHLGIFRKAKPEEMVGIAEIYNYEPDDKVSIGYRLDEPYWGQGIATCVVEMVVDYLLNQTDVKRITAHVMSENLPSDNILTRYGFRMCRKEFLEDWGFEQPVTVNEYIFEQGIH